LQTRLDFNDKIKACIIHFAEDMCDAETREALDELKANTKVIKCDKFIAVIPERFTACEDFRIQIHRYIVTLRKQNPRFKIAIVTTLLKVIGYERFAKLVTQMVDREQIFDTMDKATSWLSK
jgi:hypothetical protein